MRGLPEAVVGDAETGVATTLSARTLETSGVVPYLASRAFWSASMAGERGAEATGPVLAPGGSASSPNATPSCGPSLTPATTKLMSSIDLKPGPTSNASAASVAFRFAPILPRRARTEAGAACPCAGATSAPNGPDERATEPTVGESVSPNACPSDGQFLLPATTVFVSLIDLTPGPAFRSAPILLRRARTEAGACPCPGATRAPNCAGSTGSIEPRIAGPGVTSGESLSLTSFSIWRQRATFLWC